MFEFDFISIFSIVLLIGCIIILIQLSRGAPYLPSHRKSVENMVLLANIQAGEKMADLGSGDGRIVIAFAKKGIESHGYENNPFLVWWSRKKIKRAGLKNFAFIHMRSFWGADFSDFSIVTLFGMSHIMKGLEKKLKKELKPGARVISNAFRFPNWEMKEKKGAVLLFEKV